MQSLQLLFHKTLSAQKSRRKRVLGRRKPGGCATMARSKMVLPYLILAGHQAQFLSGLHVIFHCLW